MAIKTKVEFIDKTASVGNMIEQVANDTVAKVGQQAYKVATDLCPVDTGRLKNSITQELNVNKNKLNLSLIADTEYAIFVEFGTSKQSPQPFMQPAKDVLETIAEKVRID